MRLHQATRGGSLAPQERTSPRRPRRNSAAMRRRVGASVGCVLSGSVLLALFVPGNERFSAPGPMNRGHENMACENCHRPAPGTLRQQLQANARYLLGLRETPVDFGERNVVNEDCLACHERPFDRHPVARFVEPRFSDARAAIAPQFCESCHREHSGVRVTASIDYCAHCHGDIALKNDPLDVPHTQLAEQNSWATCLGCHDFHGNHVASPALQLSAAVAPPHITAYFEGGASYYPAELRKPALKELPSDESR